MLTTLEDAEAQILEFGLDPELIELDGRYHRCKFSGEKRTRMSGFYKLREIAREEHILVDGIFGSFKVSDRPFVTERRVSLKISSDRYEKIKEDLRKKMAIANEEEKQKQAEAAIRAEFIWEKSETSGHSEYLERKQVKAFGIRHHKGSLVIPMVKEGSLTGLQAIAGNGSKKYLYGSDTKGVYHLIKGNNEIALCEGYATGASIHMATGWSVAVCFSTNGLIAAAPYFKKKNVVICADNDEETKKKIGKNPGVDAAVKAAQYLGCNIIVPDVSDGMTDFNDLHVKFGLEEVRRQCFLI